MVNSLVYVVAVLQENAKNDVKAFSIFKVGVL